MALGALAAPQVCGADVPPAPLTLIDTVSAQAYAGNPATMFHRFDSSLSDMRAIGNYAHTPQAVVVEEGRGHLLGNVVARSYLRLNPKTVVWGDARFTTGIKKSILRNNSADYNTVAPYVLADSIGGNLSTRQYEFSGGYAGNSGKWTWGADISYTAMIDYRNRDPRDKNVVSDLHVGVGGTYAISKAYNAGIGGGLRVYNQESDIDFYNPNNNIRTYAMTGLGTWYPRFSGNSASSVAYSGLGFNAAVNIVPIDARRGVSTSFNFSYLKLDQLLRNFNNLHLTTSYTYRGTFYIGWQQTYSNVATGITFTADATRLIGFENIFGTAVGNNFVGIGRFRGYYHDCVDAALRLPLQVQIDSRWLLNADLSATAVYNHSDYPQPKRALESHSITPSLMLGARLQASKRVLTGLELTGAYRIATADRCKLTGLDTGTSAGSAVVHNFDMLTANCTSMQARLWVDITLKHTMALTFAINGCRYHYSPSGVITSATDADQATISIGARF